MPSFQWSDYIDILTELFDRKLLTTDKSSACNILYTTIINILVDRLYTERYYILTVSSLAQELPREKKGLDKRTKIVRRLAMAYYKLHLSRTQKEGDWQDLDLELNIRNKSLQLYRKDLANLTQRRQLQLQLQLQRT
jgi:hypothetical protein